MNAISTRTRSIAAAASACAAAAAPAYAGDFMVRARVSQSDPANQNTADAVITTDSVSVNTKYIWEIDASYFVTPNVAFELIAT
ncbi:hypothetical protein OY671_012919, partial [Metschnikowia pulcherrima]